MHLAHAKIWFDVLLLDEPTMIWCRYITCIRRSLIEFAYCAVVVSHVLVLDRIATHILAFEGNSHVEWFEEIMRLMKLIRKEGLAQMLHNRKKNINLYKN